MTTLPFVPGSSTSGDAADKAIDRARPDRERVWLAIASSGTRGMTDQELQVELDLPESTERPRRVSLVDAGLVADSGLVRKTRSGRDAVVWIDARLLAKQPNLPGI